LAVSDERLLVYSIGPECSLARAPILATVFKRFILSQSWRHRSRHANQSTAYKQYQVFGSDRLHKEQSQARLEFLGPLQIILQAAGEFHRTALFRHCRKHVHITAQLLNAGLRSTPFPVPLFGPVLRMAKAAVDLSAFSGDISFALPNASS
jgi:hypothetical protein